MVGQDHLDLVLQGQLAKKEGRLEDFLARNPEMRKFLVKDSVYAPSGPDGNGDEEADIVFPEGIYEHYISNLLMKFGGKEKPIERINDSIKSTMRRMSIRQPRRRPGYGLVLGRIQSGKTAHMLGLAMRSIDPSNGGVDNCYDTVIVLSGLINDLRAADQGQDFPIPRRIPKSPYCHTSGDRSQRGRRFQNQGRNI